VGARVERRTFGTRLKFAVRIETDIPALPACRIRSEAACEQIVQVPKRNFLANEHGLVRAMGGRLDESVLDDVVAAVVAVISA